MDAATLITIITMFVVTDTSSEFVKYDGLGACLKDKRAIEKLKDGHQWQKFSQRLIIVWR